MTRGARLFLRYWSVNMAYAWDSGSATIGFSYDERQRARMIELAGSVSRRGFLIWVALTVLIFILVAAAAMLGIFLPILTNAWPDATNMPASSFMLLLFTVAAVTIGLGFPLSIALGGAAADRLTGDAAPPPLPIDDEILRRARWQFYRVAGLTFGIAVPVALLFVSLGTNAPLFRLGLRIVAVALSAANGLLVWRARRRGLAG